jgi:DNA helicase-2/ATP-dependent DNA helicase PcrA
MVGFNRIGGDPRVADRARALDAYTRMRLLADPTDARAWRVFAGLGNYLCRSDAWSGFMAYAAEKSLSLNDARLALRRELEEGAEEPFLLARTLNERFEVAQSFIDENRGASGFALLNVCGCDTLPEFEELSTHLDGSESATSIASLLERLQSDVVFAPDSRALRIAPFEALAGLSFKNVYAAGLVDGFMPNRNAFEVVSTDEARNRIITTERRAFVNGLTKCRAQLILSTFATAPLELAERTHAQVVRIRSVEGKRRAYLRHTCFIDEAGHAAPSVEGGQAVLASYGID